MIFTVLLLIILILLGVLLFFVLLALLPYALESIDESKEIIYRWIKNEDEK